LHNYLPICTTSAPPPVNTGTPLAIIAPLGVTAINASYRFGPYHLDPSRRTLNRGREQVPLSDRQMDILILLTVRAGGIVSKAHGAAWPSPTTAW
jgi:hypothetical protein